MSDHRTRFTIEMMCKVFKVRKSSYYRWLKKGPSQRWQEDEKILVEIMGIFEESKASYGSSRITKELRARGRVIGKNTVASMMRAADLRAKRKKSLRSLPILITTILLHLTCLIRTFQLPDQGKCGCLTLPT